MTPTDYKNVKAGGDDFQFPNIDDLTRPKTKGVKDLHIPNIDNLGESVLSDRYKMVSPSSIYLSGTSQRGLLKNTMDRMTMKKSMIKINEADDS